MLKVSAQSWTSSCWYCESCLTPLNHQDTFEGKLWTRPGSTAWCFRRLYWCQRKLILSRRNEAANGVLLVPVTPAVSKWSLHFLGAFSAAFRRLLCAWRNESMQSFVTLCRSSLAYVAEAGAGAFGGPILLGAGVPCSEESPSSSGSLCIAEHFCNKVPSLSNWASPNELADPLGLAQCPEWNVVESGFMQTKSALPWMERSGRRIMERKLGWVSGFRFTASDWLASSAPIGWLPALRLAGF